MSLKCNESFDDPDFQSVLKDDMDTDMDMSVNVLEESNASEEKDGVYIVRSVDFFFLVTVRLTDVDMDDGVQTYEVKCVPTPSENANIDDSIPVTPCVEIEVDVGEGVGPSRLEILRFDKTCSLVGKLQRGEGTKQMLMATLAFAAQMFGENVFTFTDASSIACDKMRRISLIDYGLLVHGKTWYERTFGAIVSDPFDQERRDEYDTMLKTIVTEEQSKSLIKAFGPQRFLSDDELTRYIYIISKAAGETTWREMLRTIASDETRGCSFFSYETVDKILTLLDLSTILDFQIEMTNEKVTRYFKASQKIY